ncbi:MAG: hypothetical protein HY735_38765 [Verrucomicrobia bacterium]|nr:hypothetical protein [Verrucomicrobiota bacterium]
MNDFPIDDISLHLRASKHKEYQERVVLRFKTFVEFLQKEKLTMRELLPPQEEPPPDFKIMESDLTEEGLELVTKAYDKWLKAQDRGKSPTDVTILATGIKKIRESHS